MAFVHVSDEMRPSLSHGAFPEGAVATIEATFAFASALWRLAFPISRASVRATSLCQCCCNSSDCDCAKHKTYYLPKPQGCVGQVYTSTRKPTTTIVALKVVLAVFTNLRSLATTRRAASQNAIFSFSSRACYRQGIGYTDAHGTLAHVSHHGGNLYAPHTTHAHRPEANSYSNYIRLHTTLFWNSRPQLFSTHNLNIR